MRMARAIWSGTIDFGLVAIPVKLMAAVRDASGVHFSFLHDEDGGKIHNERVCDACGRKVPWEHVARGYEREKGEYVVVSDEEIRASSPKATQSISIFQFVDASEIDPMLFDKPYYVESEKRGRHAYALLVAALEKSRKVGLARVVMHTREHLAALAPHGDRLLLETMRWAEDVAPAPPTDLPKTDGARAPEMKAAMMLIDAMSAKLDTSALHDTFRDKILDVIERKAEGKPPKKEAGPARPTNVIDLADVLQRSIAQAKQRPRAQATAHATAKKRR